MSRSYEHALEDVSKRGVYVYMKIHTHLHMHIHMTNIIKKTYIHSFVRVPEQMKISKLDPCLGSHAPCQPASLPRE